AAEIFSPASLDLVGDVALGDVDAATGPRDVEDPCERQFADVAVNAVRASLAHHALAARAVIGVPAARDLAHDLQRRRAVRAQEVFGADLYRWTAHAAFFPARAAVVAFSSSTPALIASPSLLKD